MAESERNGLVSNGHQNQPKNHERALSNWQRLSYGVGHVYNDLVASMWFSYLLIFLHEVETFNNFLAGNLMLIGQIADAICTPFIGYESDHTQKGLFGLGKRKSWHFIGTFCVLASFPFLFQTCITCSNAPNIAQFVYFAPFVVILQFGWASTQISHLSFSSELTPFNQERVTLQSIRNVFTIFANISVYGIFSLLLYLESNHNPGEKSSLGPADAPKFRNLAFICMGIGVFFNIIFYLGTHGAGKEKNLTPVQQTQNGCQSVTPNANGRVENGEILSTIEVSTIQHSLMTWKDWLKEIQFYQIAVLYMCTRLYINISQVYFGIYLTETVKMDKIYIAILPLFTYSASFITSVLTPYINKFLGRKLAFATGVVFGIASCIWMYFIQVRSHQVYGSAILLGVAGSILLITSLSMTSDLIAGNTETGAFVFGAMSFTDKLSNGLAIFVIQKFHPCKSIFDAGWDAAVCKENCCPACQPYYRNVQSVVPGVALLVAFIALLTLLPQNIGVRENKSKVSLMKSPTHTATPCQSTIVECDCGRFYAPPGYCVNCSVSSTGAFPPCQEVDYSDVNDDDEVRPLLTTDSGSGEHIINDINA